MAFLRSVRWKQHSPDVDEGQVEGGEPKASAADSRVLRLRKVPWVSEPLKDAQVERLSLMPSLSVRGFELVFENGRTDLLLSSRSEQSMRDYVDVSGLCIRRAGRRSSIPEARVPEAAAGNRRAWLGSSSLSLKPI